MKIIIFLICLTFPLIANAGPTLEQAQAAALKGNPNAQFDMCGFYYLGTNGAPKNPIEAAKWCSLAEKQGHVEATYNLALMYQNGEGVGQNINEATRLYAEAAAKGHKDAQYNLTQISLANNPAPAKQKNAVPAIPVYPKIQSPAALAPVSSSAATPPLAPPAPEIAAPTKPPVVQNIQPPKLQSFSKSQIKESNCQQAAQKGILADNCGGAQNTEPENILENEFSSQIKSLTADAQSGNITAQKNLASLYRSGSGVPQDSAKAFQLFEKVANQGNPEAMTNFASMYKSGEGIAADPEKAYSWYSLAADRLPAGELKNEALLNVKNLSAELNNEQLGRALNFVTELDKKIPLIKN